MKATLVCSLLAVPMLLMAQSIPDIPPEGVLMLDTSRLPKEPPLFFRIETQSNVTGSAAGLTTRIDGTITIVQGKPKAVRIGITGKAPITSVTGDGIASWAERTEPSGNRLLELEIKSDSSGKFPATVRFSATSVDPVKRSASDSIQLTLPAPGESVGFSGEVIVQTGGPFGLRPTRVEALSEVRDNAVGTLRFRGNTSPILHARWNAAAPAPAELTNARLSGVADEASNLVAFTMTGTATVTEPGARLPVLSGLAALSNIPHGNGWRIEVEDAKPAPDAQSKSRTAPPPVLVAIFEKPGSYPLQLTFDARIERGTGWNALNFSAPAGTIVPVEISGLAGQVEFAPDSRVQPMQRDGKWTAFLPASGECDVAWRNARATAGVRLFINSTGRTDIAVGAGRISQSSEFSIRILQGKLEHLSFVVHGEGEIVEVTGTNVAAWNVTDADGVRRVEVVLSRPIDNQAQFNVRSQTSLGDFPSRATPLRLVPDAGEVRHSGTVRVRNDGAVRFEALSADGLMQLAPDQWPGARDGQAPRQAAVYRFPLPDYTLTLEARQVLPELNVNQIVIYEVAESDRVILADLELEVREAPLREWSIDIPDGYAVASCTGAEVADTFPGEAADGRRTLRIMFNAPVEGRSLIRLRLEQNTAAAAGEWKLPALRFPDAKSVRGFVGAKAAPGFRIAPGTVDGITETPVSYFPNQPRDLQQAFRVRQPDWSASVRIEPLTQSVTADLFHLYSLREGVVYGSVIMNFFVVGAPVNEWKLKVPASAGNLSIDGQEVRSWRQDGDTVIVSLDRPALGAATLLATFEHPMNSQGGEIVLGELSPVGVESERGYVQVVSPLQVRSDVVKSSPQLLRLEAGELPPELKLLTSAPSLAVYQYAARPFELKMKLEWFQQAETVAQVVDFAKLESRVSRDGQIVTDARYFVKARGLGMLRITLPPNSRLWEARVDGVVATARTEGADTLVPLPSTADPDKASEVAIRYGVRDSWPVRVQLSAPNVVPPVMITEWQASAERGRLLVPGTSASLSPGRVVTESGFTWLMQPANRWILWLCAGGGMLAALCAGFSEGRVAFRLMGILALAGVCLFCLVGALSALGSRQVNIGTLQLVAPITASGLPVSLHAWNLPVWMAMISIPGLVLVAAGLGAAIFLRKKVAGAGILAWVCISTGLMLQHGGAAPFLLWLALSLIVSLAGRLFRSARTLPAAATASLALFFMIPNGADAAAVMQSVDQSIRIDKGRATVTASVLVAGAQGETFTLLFAPGILTGFTGEGLSAAKVGEGADAWYTVTVNKAGTWSASLTYEMPVPESATEINLPTGPAASDRVDIERSQAGWGFTSSKAIRSVPKTLADRSGSVLTFMPGGPRTIVMAPKLRDVRAEKTVFYAETANLFVPAPGVIDGTHRIRIRVSQGELASLRIRIPARYMVGEVTGGNLQDSAADWKFDPDQGLLNVTLPSPQRGEFTFDVRTQSAAGRLPATTSIAPVRILDAAGDIGTVGVAFGPDAQPEQIKPDGLTAINLDDFPIRIAIDEVHLHKVYRYGAQDASLEVRIGEVAPELRTVTQQVLSLGEERTLLSIDLTTDIRRAGVFRLSFALPDKFETESITGPALSHWTEVTDGGTRKVVMHLAGRTVGPQKFAVTLIGPPAEPSEKWPVPRFSIDDTERASGTLVIVPDKGFRIRTVERDGISQTDARDSGNVQPGSIAFRVLQSQWNLALGVERLDPWVTARVLHEIRVREGQARHRIALRYRVEGAAVKVLRVTLPGIDDESARSVRADGENIADIVRVQATDTWEIRFRRGMLGDVPVQVDYAERLASDKLRVTQPVVPDARQVTSFAALHTTGRLDLSIASSPAGWQRLDWDAVPEELRDTREPSPAQLAMRVADGSAPLEASIRRQETADALKLRVEHGAFATVFSARGDSATAARLRVRVNEKSTMSIQLPKSARLFQVAVNEEDVPVVESDGRLLFYVMPPAEENDPAVVEIVYAVAGGGRARGKVALTAPALNVPLENVEWSVVVPKGWELTGHGGSLTLRKSGLLGEFGIDEYLSASSSLREEKVRSTNDLMTKADEWLKKGEQGKARVALNKAAKTSGIDEATNEDARVQLRNLYNQQAVLGLNTRRQKLYLDNNALDASVQNAQMEQAARANPLINGSQSFDIQQVDQLLQGNSSEETTALKRVADRIVSQQIAAEPAPRTVAPTLPQGGTEYTFTRSVQVDGDKPLSLQLKLERTSTTSLATMAFLIASLGVLSAIVSLAGRRRSGDVAV